MQRRQFLSRFSAASLLALLDAHEVFDSLSTPAFDQHHEDPYIQHIQLETATPLDELAIFYHSQLGFPIIAYTANQITFQAGASQLTFHPTPDADQRPFYHFAFNIPENKILAARDWQLERCPLIPAPRHMTMDGFPNDIRYFRNWDAHSVFFWDPAGNLVEYIARHTLNNAAPGPFSNRDILYASEIAFIVHDVEATSKYVATHLNLAQYQQGSANFRALGDERGLLLFMKKGRIWESQTPQAKRPDLYPTEVKVAGNTDLLSFEHYPYRLF